MSTITDTNLKEKVKILNRIIGIEEDADSLTPRKYSLKKAYRDVALVRMSAYGRGNITVFKFTTKRALYDLIMAYIAGYNEGSSD